MLMFSICFFVFMCECRPFAQSYTWKLENGVGSPGTGGTDICEPTNLGARN